MTSKELQELKYQRLSEPEKIILKSFKGLKEYFYKFNLNWVYYKSDMGIFYKYNIKNGWLEYDYDLIYTKIELYFDSNQQIIDDFVQRMVEKHIKLNVVTTDLSLIISKTTKDKYLKLKTVTKY